MDFLDRRKQKCQKYSQLQPAMPSFCESQTCLLSKEAKTRQQKVPNTTGIVRLLNGNCKKVKVESKYHGSLRDEDHLLPRQEFPWMLALFIDH